MSFVLLNRDQSVPLASSRATWYQGTSTVCAARLHWLHCAIQPFSYELLLVGSRLLGDNGISSCETLTRPSLILGIVTYLDFHLLKSWQFYFLCVSKECRLLSLYQHHLKLFDRFYIQGFDASTCTVIKLDASSIAFQSVLAAEFQFRPLAEKM